MSSIRIPQITIVDFERQRERHRLPGAIARWVAHIPERPAIISADRGQKLTWAEMERQTTALAIRLLGMGLKRGDFFATCLPLTIEHILLEYACFKIGVIFAPLDLRLPPAEVVRSVALIQAKGFAFPGQTGAADFRELGEEVRRQCPSIEHLVQFSPPGQTVEGALSYAKLAAGSGSPEMETAYREAAHSLKEDDGALAIFTTGSTGSPKPALLSHRNITCQNLCLREAIFGDEARTLVNLPPSHVGCQTELLMSTLFAGGTAVILEVFDPGRSLRAIPDFRVNILGQIPAMFNFEWRLKDYAKYDLSSLALVAYGGQQVSPSFAKMLGTMAPRVATGLGLTEAAGFCTYVIQDAAQAEEVAATLGHAMPVYPMTIRHPMQENGSAGAEVPEGDVGHICFHGPQTFLGYVNDPEATARAISRDGYLYTGDLGFNDAAGLHLTGRAKWVIKTAGYQVFPADIENHICALQDKVAWCAVVGVEHPAISEAIVAFVERKPGAELTRAELEKHARGLPAYMRPRRYILLEPGQMPLNRAIKPDYLRLSEIAKRDSGIE